MALTITAAKRRLPGDGTDEKLDPDEFSTTIDGEVPSEGWKQPAEAFLSRLEPD